MCEPSLADGVGLGQYRTSAQGGPNAMTNDAESIIRDVMASDTYRAAVATLAAEHDRTVEDIVALTEIAAPSFQEETRARAFLSMAEAHGLKNLEIDAEGNVTGVRPGVATGH
jgi:tripeptide aminopeptidase